MSGTAIWHHLQGEGERKIGEGSKGNRGIWELKEREHVMVKMNKKNR